MANKATGKATKSSKPKAKSLKLTPAKSKISKASQALPAKLPGVLELAKSSWLIIWHNRKTVSIIVAMYGLVYLVLVLGLANPASSFSLKKGLTSFTDLVGSSTSSSTPAGSAYQFFILIIASLSIIWALRQFYLGSKIRARDAYYKGLYPLIPYTLVLLFIALELIPLILGLGLYGLLVSGNIAVTAAEKILTLIPSAILVGLSLYLVSSSTIALYIVTLPNMTPLKALRSAKGIVRGRRWSVLRKILFLPLVLLIAAAVVVLPFIFVVPVLAGWIFFVLTLFGLVYIHSYLYSLYRGLINE